MARKKTAITRSSQKVIRRMAEKLASEMRPQQIYLFGSYAWGEPNENSDVDFCLVYTKVKPQQILSLMQKAHASLADFRFAKDIIIKSTDRMESLRPYHAPLESQILRNGKLLYDASARKRP